MGNIDRQMRWGIIGMTLAVVGGVILNLALLSGLIWVAWHFISKFW